MSYMNREQRRALKKRDVTEVWTLGVEYANGEVDLTAFGNEADARRAFQMVLGVRADEPGAILHVAVLDPKRRLIVSSSGEVST